MLFDRVGENDFFSHLLSKLVLKIVLRALKNLLNNGSTAENKIHLGAINV